MDEILFEDTFPNFLTYHGQKQIIVNAHKIKNLNLSNGKENVETTESIIFDVKLPNELFTGRKHELDILHKKIQRKTTHSTLLSKITCIHGLGGIGKSELARKYAEIQNTWYEGNILWINAATEQTLKESFYRLLTDKLDKNSKNKDGQDKSMKTIVEEVYMHFVNKKCLFIFDNAEDNKTIKNFLPITVPKNAIPFILITSRNKEWEREIYVLPLKELIKEDAVELVKKRLAHAIDDDVNKLVIKLQCFPLAIQQAVAFIDYESDTRPYDICDYLEEFEKETEFLLDTDNFQGIGVDYDKTTLTTWKMTIDKIRNDKKCGKLAFKIFNIMAYLAPENIVKDIFINIPKTNEKEIRSAVNVLVKYSMVNSTQQQSILYVHRLVQEVTRLNLPEKKDIIEETYHLLMTYFPKSTETIEDINKMKNILLHLEELLLHVRKLSADSIKQNEIEKKLLVLMDTGYETFGNNTRQKELLERVLEIQEQSFTKNASNFEIVTTLNLLSTVYWHLGDYKNMKQYLERAIKIQKTHYRPTQKAHTLNLLGLAHAYMGENKIMKEYVHKALKVQKNHDSNNVEIAKTLTTLGIAYGKLKNYEMMIDYCKQALEIEEKHYGLNSIAIINTLSVLGYGYKIIGNYSRSQNLLERSLEIQEKVYDKTHFALIHTLNLLGTVYGHLKYYQKMKHVLDRALAIQENHFGHNYYKIAETLHVMGDYYKYLGNYEEMKNQLEHALDLQVNHYGKEHLGITYTLSSLGYVYGQLGNFHKKVEYLKRCLAIQDKNYSTESFKRQEILSEISKAYEYLDNNERKKKYLNRISSNDTVNIRDDNMCNCLILSNIRNYETCSNNTNFQ